jgi:hypothetical protein
MNQLPTVCFYLDIAFIVWACCRSAHPFMIVRSLITILSLLDNREKYILAPQTTTLSPDGPQTTNA